MLAARRFSPASAPSLLPASAQQLDKVTFGTNWLAEAEHGGYYQAVADGTYAAYGLDVTIMQGGPQAATGRCCRRARSISTWAATCSRPSTPSQQGIPMRRRRRHFQKDPQVLMSHPGEGLDKCEDLKNADSTSSATEGVSLLPSMDETEPRASTEDKREPYTFNPAPFIADKKSMQQGYVTSEPFAVEKEGGFEPNVFLLADNGFDTYSTTIETMQDTIDKKPEVVQCFVDGSAKGWYNYLYGDNKAANELIKKDNPDMTDEQIAFSIEQMKKYRHRRFRRRREARHRRHDRRAHEELLRQDGQGQGPAARASTSRRPTRWTSSTRASAST